ncbi:MAG: hypothetical protein HUU46_03575 [Candidatus Hydrogenedentes bacterium]|nr:hypothetical protein [Candidatus Hydrogenedentota bacterium]
MKTKRLDCVEMKREGSKRIYDALKGKSRDEQVEYWRKKNIKLRPRKSSAQLQDTDPK